MRKSLSLIPVLLLAAALALPGVAARAQDTTPAITVADQLSVNGMVIISNVTAANAGWVEIHADMNGAPGPAVGIAPVQAGSNDNLQVMIDASGATPILYAMLHTDDNSPGVFEFEKNPAADAPVMVNQQPVMAPFHITAIRVYDQMINNNAVTVASVITEQGGWLAIHGDNGGQPGDVLGQAQLRPGTNAGVIVPLNDGAAATPLVWAVLHTDDNTTGTFEAGTVEGADAPVMVNDQMAAAPINSTSEPTLLNAAGMPLATQNGQAPFINATSQGVEGVGSSDATANFTVDRALSVGPGWLDVHADANGHPGASLGVTQLPDGESDGLTVELNPKENPALIVPIPPVVWPMLHTDDGQAGVYEFMMVPGADLPVVFNGAVVTLPVTIGGEGQTGAEATQAAGTGATEAAPAATEAAPAATEAAGSDQSGAGTGATEAAPAATEASSY